MDLFTVCIYPATVLCLILKSPCFSYLILPIFQKSTVKMLSMLRSLFPVVGKEDRVESPKAHPKAPLVLDPRAPAVLTPHPTSSGYKNSVYLIASSAPNAKNDTHNLPAEKLSHVYFGFFSPTSNGHVYPPALSNGSSKDVQDRQFVDLIGNLSTLKQRHRHLKVILTVGGLDEGIAAIFAALSAVESKRASFAASVLGLIRDCGLDGVYVDWEWPKDSAEASDYTALLRDLRRALDEHFARDGGNPLSLMVACPAGTEQYQHLDLRAMNGIVDNFNLVAYDFASSGSSDVTAHQANLLTGSDRSKTPHNTAQAISDFEDSGVPPEKITLGCPLYGRGFADTDGLGRPFSARGPDEGSTDREGGVFDYKDLPLAGAEAQFDPTANASYTYDKQKRELVSYDDPTSLTMKAEFIKSQQLGGAMFFEASMDRTDDGSLVGLVSLAPLVGTPRWKSTR